MAGAASGHDPLGDLLRDLVNAEQELVEWGERRGTAFAALEALTRERAGDAQLAALAAQLRAVTEQHGALAEQLRALQRQALATEEGAPQGERSRARR